MLTHPGGLAAGELDRAGRAGQAGQGRAGVGAADPVAEAAGGDGQRGEHLPTPPVRLGNHSAANSNKGGFVLAAGLNALIL